MLEKFLEVAAGTPSAAPGTAYFSVPAMALLPSPVLPRCSHGQRYQANTQPSRPHVQDGECRKHWSQKNYWFIWHPEFCINSRKPEIQKWRCREKFLAFQGMRTRFHTPRWWCLAGNCRTTKWRPPARKLCTAKWWHPTLEFHKTRWWPPVPHMRIAADAILWPMRPLASCCSTTSGCFYYCKEGRGRRDNFAIFQRNKDEISRFTEYSSTTFKERTKFAFFRYEELLEF